MHMYLFYIKINEGNNYIYFYFMLKVKISMRLSNILKEAKEEGSKEITISTEILYLVLLLFPGRNLGETVSYIPNDLTCDGAPHSLLVNVVLKH